MKTKKQRSQPSTLETPSVKRAAREIAGDENRPRSTLARERVRSKHERWSVEWRPPRAPLVRSGKAAANIRSDSSYRANFNIYEQAMP